MPSRESGTGQVPWPGADLPSELRLSQLFKMSAAMTRWTSGAESSGFTRALPTSQGYGKPRCLLSLED